MSFEIRFTLILCFSIFYCSKNLKTDLTETTHFYETYVKVVAPLLFDCWLEAKPENKSNKCVVFIS